MLTVEPRTGHQTMSQAEVDRFITEQRMAPKNRNKPVLGIRMAEMMKAKNNGYPKHLYHATLAPRLALDEVEEEAYVSQGYTEQYIPRAFPKFLYRRNMDSKFKPNFDKATGVLTNEPFVETRQAKDEHDEKVLRAMKTRPGQSVWYESVAELNDREPIPEQEYVNPDEEIARLKGQIEALTGNSEAEKQSGRKAKEPVTE